MDRRSVTEVLESRARALAQPLDSESKPGAQLEVIQFSLSGEHYAVAAEFVREAVPLKDFSPIPCTPAFVLGMMNLRGQILTLINIARLFDLPSENLSDLNRILVLRERDTEFGILADAILGAGTVRLDDLQPTVPTLGGIRSELLLGVTSERLIVLDAQKLLSHEALVVKEEPSA
jgi:purine-binding chemotaxis protein CheW